MVGSKRSLINYSRTERINAMEVASGVIRARHFSTLISYITFNSFKFSGTIRRATGTNITHPVSCSCCCYEMVSAGCILREWPNYLQNLREANEATLAPTRTVLLAPTLSYRQSSSSNSDVNMQDIQSTPISSQSNPTLT